MSGSLDQMAEQAVVEQETEGSVDESSAEPTQTPAEPDAQTSETSEPAEASVETPATEQPAAEAQAESFTHIDPKTLSPELQQVYKSLQADYTRKRQAETARVRELEAQVAAHGQNAPQVPTQPGNPQDFLGQMGLTPEQLEKMSLPEYTQYVLEAAKRGIQIESETKSIESFESQAVVDFLSTDPRLNPEIEGSFEPRMATWVGSEMDKAYEKYIAETGSPLGFDHRAEATKLVGQWDSWIDSQVKNKVAKTTQMAKTNAQRHQKAAPPTSSARSQAAGGMGIEDAFDSAFDEQNQ